MNNSLLQPAVNSSPCAEKARGVYLPVAGSDEAAEVISFEAGYTTVASRTRSVVFY
jgi:hypothetical protein